ncbi:MAG: alpha-hydroxy-acid oxidizing protein, partial [Pseudolabrys sp.]
AGVERALVLMKNEVTRAMRLMGAKSIRDLSRKNLKFRS